MSNVVVPIETDPHQAVLALLPWYARERLSGEEQSTVREHLQHCAACRAELEAERSLQAALVDSREEAPVSARDTEAALRRMRQLMKTDAPTPAKRSWMPWAIGLQAAAIAVLAVVVARATLEAPAPYKALSAAPMTVPAAGQAETLVMFRPGADEAGIRKALLAHHAVMIGGPTESGAYRVQLPGGAQALAALRAEGVVALAESLEPPQQQARP